jgi:hypothetical protein
MARRKPPALDLAALLPSWELSLRADDRYLRTRRTQGRVCAGA